MFPVIDKKKTGIHLRKIMDERGLSVKDLQSYLNLGSVQSIYHWLNGISLPTVDNLYALSKLFGLPMDELLCGNRGRIPAGTHCLNCECMGAYPIEMQEKRAA